MKTLFALSLILISSTAFASGYRCEGGDYRVAVYNHVDPSMDTSAPAVMVVSRRDEGTIAVIPSDKITTDQDDDDDDDGIVYEGQGNSKLDGSFISVRLEIKEKSVHTEEGLLHGGTFLINFDHGQDVVAMRCRAYPSQ